LATFKKNCAYANKFMEGQIGQVGTSRLCISECDRNTWKADWLLCLKSESPEQLKKCE